MKTFKCPTCGGNLPDPGTRARIECRYCGSVVDVQPDARGGVRVRAWSKVAISKKRDYESKGKHHSAKISANVYAGTSSVEIGGPLTEAKVEMPGSGPGSIYIRSGSSEHVGSFPVDQLAGDDSSVDTLDGAEAPGVWMDSIERELRQLASSMGIPLAVLTFASLLVPFLCCVATMLAIGLVLFH
jgi:DNA-directed RNA polymerase subunit RPC12/RpoP